MFTKGQKVKFVGNPNNYTEEIKEGSVGIVSGLVTDYDDEYDTSTIVNIGGKTFSIYIEDLETV